MIIKNKDLNSIKGVKKRLDQLLKEYNEKYEQEYLNLPNNSNETIIDLLKITNIMSNYISDTETIILLINRLIQLKIENKDIYDLKFWKKQLNILKTCCGSAKYHQKIFQTQLNKHNIINCS